MQKYKDYIQGCEKAYMVKILKATNNNILHAADISGILRSQFHRMLDRNGIVILQHSYNARRDLPELKKADDETK